MLNYFKSILYLFIFLVFTSCSKNPESLNNTAEETVTDIDGNVYQTVKIGNQLWLAENLKTTHYRNGEDIPLVANNTEWSNLSTGAYSNYDNNSNNAIDFGRLYNWYAIIDDRNIAPLGWHIPTDSEWKQLEMYLGMAQNDADATGWRGTDEGGKLKEESTIHWSYPNTGATNSSGFLALPGGYRYASGGFTAKGTYAFFGSISEPEGNDTWYRVLYYNYSTVAHYNNNNNRSSGFSVRCVQD